MQIILENIVIIQIVILSIVGSLVGELFRTLGIANPVSFTRCVAEFLASALFSIILTLAAMEFFVKNRVVLSILSLYLGFVGYSVSSKYASAIMDNVIKSILDTKSKKKP